MRRRQLTKLKWIQYAPTPVNKTEVNPVCTGTAKMFWVLWRWMRCLLMTVRIGFFLMNALSFDSPHWILLRWWKFCVAHTLLMQKHSTNIHKNYNCTETQLAGIRHITGHSIHRKTVKYTTGRCFGVEIDEVIIKFREIKRRGNWGLKVKVLW